MNKQEMRRLGLIPYEENTDTSGWMTTRPRRRRRARLEDITIERTEINIPSRRMNGWRHIDVPISDEVIERAAQQLSDSIDQTLIEQLTENTVEINPNRTENNMTLIQRLISRFGRYRPNGN